MSAGTSLIVSGISRASNSVQITWQTSVGKDYQVLYKDDLAAASWTTLGSSFTATNATATLTDPLTNHPRFYLIQEMK